MSTGTLIGALPGSWRQSELGKVAKWGSGGTPKANNSVYYGGSIPWAIIGDLNDGIVTKTANSITQLGLDESSSKLVPKGTLLIAMYGSIGKLGIAGVDLATNQAIAFATPLKDVVTHKFLFLYLASQKEVFLASGKGMTQQNISQTVLKAWPIPLPPIDEQEKVVEILEEQLSRLDAALASVRSVRKKAAQFRRSLLSAAFSGSLSGHESVVGVLPLGWKLEPLGKCGQWFGGGTPSKSNQKFWDDGTIPWLSPKDMGEFRIRETQDKITTDAVEQSSTKLVPGPSVAMVMRSGILERTFPIAVVDFDITLNQDMKAVVPNGGVSVLWIAYALNAFEMELLDTCRKSGTTVASMETVRLMNFKIPLPEISEQLKIIGILEEQISRLDASLAIADAIENKVNALRRSLLHSAFTGNLTREWREGANV